MELIISLAALLGALTLGAMSPGPSFVLVARTAIVALALSSASPRAAYLRFKALVDRTAGTVLGILGLKLVASAREP